MRARKELSVHEVPNILTIVLKRFQVRSTCIMHPIYTKWTSRCIKILCSRTNFYFDAYFLQSGKYGKINKCVTFPEMLDMIPFVTGTADKPPLYLLYAVIVHLDNQNASFSGHYISYVKDMQGNWLRIDDSEVIRQINAYNFFTFWLLLISSLPAFYFSVNQVQMVQLSQVMSEGAYMLFYSRYIFQTLVIPIFLIWCLTLFPDD